MEKYLKTVPAPKKFSPMGNTNKKISNYSTQLRALKEVSVGNSSNKEDAA